jgi:TrmH family RNA methyltransferase
MAFVAEGPKVLAAALDAGAPVESVLCAPSASSHEASSEVVRRASAAGVPVHELAEGVMERLSGTVTPQPVLGVLPFLDVPLASVGRPTLALVLVDVQDPGNVGSSLRSAHAAGAEAALLCGTTADLYNPKVVRASAGALFGLSVAIEADPEAALRHLAAIGARTLAAVPRGGEDYASANLRGAVALVVGNESRGLAGGLCERADSRLTVPMHGRAKSLNVAVAAGVLLFEAARQRRLAGRSHSEQP